MNRRLGQIISIVAVVLTLGIIFSFGSLCLRYAVNLPIWDDFDSALFFMNRYTDAQSFREKLWLIYEQHNEHRIIVSRILTILSVGIFSEINFTYIIYCSTLALIALSVLLGLNSKEPRVTILLSTAIMLQPQYGDGLNWVTTAVPNFFVCLFALISSILVSASSIKYWFLLPTMTVACYTLGNGFLLSICLALSLVFEKRWKDIGIIISFGAIIAGLYFIAYGILPHSQKPSDLYANIPRLLEYGFTLIGASIGFSNKLASLLCGIILTFLFFIVLTFSNLRKNSRLVPFLFFLFLSAALNTAGRGLSGTDFAISPGRYTVISSGIVGALAFIFYQYLSTLNFRIRYFFIPLALVFNFYSYRQYSSAVEGLYIKTITDLVQFISTGSGLTYPWPDRGLPILAESEKKGLYHLPIEGLKLHQRANLNVDGFVRPHVKNLRHRVEIAQVRSEYVLLGGWALIKSCPSSNTTTYVKLIGNSATLLIEALKLPRSDLEARFKDSEHHAPGFLTMIPRAWLEKGAEYRFELLVQCQNKKYMHTTRYVVSQDDVISLKTKKS